MKVSESSSSSIKAASSKTINRINKIIGKHTNINANTKNGCKLNMSWAKGLRKTSAI